MTRRQDPREGQDPSNQPLKPAEGHEALDVETPADTYPELRKGHTWLARLRDHHRQLVGRFLAAGGGVWPTDLFMLGVANRSYYLLDAYLDAFDKWNIFVAAPIVRMQLDNLVRVSYLAHHSHPHDFTMRLVNGEEFRRIKHDDGQLLTDRKLVDIADPAHPWLDPVYKESSSWVHLSPLHITAPLSLDEKKMTLGMEFPFRRERIPRRLLREIQGAMTRATEELFGYMEVWEHRKDNPIGMSEPDPHNWDPRT